MRIVLVGPPGAGKGTQASLISKSLQIPHISTGEMIRSAIASGSALGAKVKAVNDRGELVSDDLMKEVVTARLATADCDNGFLMDGYPRTVRQVEHFDEILKNLSQKCGKNLTVDHVIEFKVPKDVLLARLKGRADTAASGPRADDDISVAKKRLDVYETQTAPLINLYRTKGLVREIDGVGEVADVASRVSEIVKSKKS